MRAAAERNVGILFGNAAQRRKDGERPIFAGGGFRVWSQNGIWVERNSFVRFFVAEDAWAFVARMRCLINLGMFWRASGNLFDSARRRVHARSPVNIHSRRVTNSVFA